MNKQKEQIERRLVQGPFLTIYNRDYIKRDRYNVKSIEEVKTKQEFKDPIREGFRNFLTLGDPNVKPPKEDADEYLEKMAEQRTTDAVHFHFEDFPQFKENRPEIGNVYFENPLDHITIKGEQLLNGKSEYQVDYCDIEADIKRKLMDENKQKLELPEGWEIPATTHKTDFRPPLLLSEHAMDPPPIIKTQNNLGQNENINKILNVKTGESEYSNTIGKLGDFIVVHEMHGKIEKVNWDV